VNITTEEYRKILKDYSSSEDLIKRRLEYLMAFCRKIAKIELEKYIKECKSK